MSITLPVGAARSGAPQSPWGAAPGLSAPRPAPRSLQQPWALTHSPPPTSDVPNFLSQQAWAPRQFEDLLPRLPPFSPMNSALLATPWQSAVPAMPMLSENSDHGSAVSAVDSRTALTGKGEGNGDHPSVANRVRGHKRFAEDNANNDEVDVGQRTPTGFMGHVAVVVVSHPLLTLAVWCCIIVWALLTAGAFYHATTALLQPLPDSLSGRAKAAFGEHFPDLTGQIVDDILFEFIRPDANFFNSQELLESARQPIDDVVEEIMHETPGAIVRTNSWGDTGGPLENNNITGNSFISADGRTCLMMVTWGNANAHSYEKHGEYSNDFHQAKELALFKFFSTVRVTAAQFADSDLRVGVTGTHALMGASKRATMEDVGVHAVMFLPVALLIMWTQLHKWQFMPLAAACILVATVLAMAFGYIVATYVRVVDANVPTVVAFLCVALCTDWSFFLLARFGEEATRGKAHNVAVTIAMQRTGGNVLLSGCVIVLCAACYEMMPAAIASNAVGVYLAVSAGLASCLTMLPAMLVAFPRCFTVPRAAELGSSVALLSDEDSDEAMNLSDSRRLEIQGLYSSRRDMHVADHVPESRRRPNSQRGCFEAKADLRETLWYRWAVLVSTTPWNYVALLGVTTLFMPTTLRLLHFEPLISDALLVPQDAPEVIADRRLREAFPHRTRSRSSWFLLVEASPTCPEGVRSNGYFASTCALAKGLVGLSTSEEPMEASNVFGVAFYNRRGTPDLTCIPWENDNNFLSNVHDVALDQGDLVDGKMLLTGDHILRLNMFEEFHRLYASLWDRAVSRDGLASAIVMHLSFDIMNMKGFALVEAIRNMLQREEARANNRPVPEVEHRSRSWHPFSFFRPHRSAAQQLEDAEDALCGSVRVWELAEISVWYDYLLETISVLPIALGCACLLTTPLLVCSFGGAVVAPVKITLSVILPLTWVYGSAVVCYEDGLFDFLGDTPLHSTGGVHWMVPCISSILLLALALDYDLFYFGRVYELRRAGLEDLEAIRQGLAATGPMITCAGVIFAVEFSGLFLSSSGLNRQIGFCVVLGVIVDTFVVRSTLVPALLSIRPDSNWWPSKMPAPKPGAAELYLEYGAQMDLSSSDGEEDTREDAESVMTVP